VAKRKTSFRGKRRTREHVIADLAVNHVERHVLLRGFTLERIVHDYGYDLVIFTYNADGEPQEGAIYLQVKAAERTKRVEAGRAISFRLDRADLQAWLAEPMPVVLCVYDVAGDVAYWLYTQRHFESRPGFNLFKAGKTVGVRIPTTQVLDTAAVGKFARFLADVQKQMRGRIRHV
jgi:hypothetical protein